MLPYLHRPRGWTVRTGPDLLHVSSESDWVQRMWNVLLLITLRYLTMSSCDPCQLRMFIMQHMHHNDASNMIFPPLYTASETNPVSVCASCSSSHAGMRWMVHSSNEHNIDKGVNSINFEFHCDNLEENEVCNQKGYLFITTLNAIKKWPLFLA